MSQDENWVGVTPEPPQPDAPTCRHVGGTADCPVSCMTVYGDRYVTEENDRHGYSLVGTPDPPHKPTCVSDGHDWEHAIDSMGDLLIVHCTRCGRSWRCEET